MMSTEHWVVKVGLEPQAAHPEGAARRELVERIEKLHMEVQSVIAVGPLVLLVEPQRVVNIDSLAERLSVWPGVAYARAVLRSDVGTSAL
jgi:hypothetical protein